jgi:hypothetical protein
MFLVPRIGDLPARRISVFTGIGLIFIVAVLSVRWLRVHDTQSLLKIGAVWVSLTVVFELALGRLVLSYEWGRILLDYDLSRGGLMSIGLVAMLFTPLAAARIRGVHSAVL